MPCNQTSGNHIGVNSWESEHAFLRSYWQPALAMGFSAASRVHGRQGGPAINWQLASGKAPALVQPGHRDIIDANRLKLVIIMQGLQRLHRSARQNSTKFATPFEKAMYVCFLLVSFGDKDKPLELRHLHALACGPSSCSYTNNVHALFGFKGFVSWSLVGPSDNEDLCI